jgi:hypothetical protein
MELSPAAMISSKTFDASPRPSTTLDLSVAAKAAAVYANKIAINRSIMLFLQDFS